VDKHHSRTRHWPCTPALSPFSHDPQALMLAGDVNLCWLGPVVPPGDLYKRGPVSVGFPFLSPIFPWLRSRRFISPSLLCKCFRFGLVSSGIGKRGSAVGNREDTGRSRSRFFLSLSPFQPQFFFFFSPLMTSFLDFRTIVLSMKTRKVPSPPPTRGRTNDRRTLFLLLLFSSFMSRQVSSRT